jgi:hypothetical protein
MLSNSDLPYKWGEHDEYKDPQRPGTGRPSHDLAWLGYFDESGYDSGYNRSASTTIVDFGDLNPRTIRDEGDEIQQEQRHKQASSLFNQATLQVSPSLSPVTTRNIKALDGTYQLGTEHNKVAATYATMSGSGGDAISSKTSSGTNPPHNHQQLHGFKIWRKPGSYNFDFEPPQSSDELFYVLKNAFPSFKTHQQRMRQAVIEFCLSEQKSDEDGYDLEQFSDIAETTLPNAVRSSTPGSLWSGDSGICLDAYPTSHNGMEISMSPSNLPSALSDTLSDIDHESTFKSSQTRFYANPDLQCDRKRKRKAYAIEERKKMCQTRNRVSCDRCHRFRRRVCRP